MQQSERPTFTRTSPQALSISPRRGVAINELVFAQRHNDAELSAQTNKSHTVLSSSPHPASSHVTRVCLARQPAPQRRRLATWHRDQRALASRIVANLTTSRGSATRLKKRHNSMQKTTVDGESNSTPITERSAHAKSGWTITVESTTVSRKTPAEGEQIEEPSCQEVRELGCHHTLHFPHSSTPC